MLAPTLFALLLQPGIEGPAPPPAGYEAPLAAPRRSSTTEMDAAKWHREQRRFQIGAGLSGAFAGLMVVTGTLLILDPLGCRTCELDLLRFFSGVAILPLAAIPTATGIYWGVRLHRHGRQRPVVLRPGAGGFALHF